MSESINNGIVEDEFSENDMAGQLEKIARILCEYIPAVQCCSIRLIEGEYLKLKLIYGFDNDEPREDIIPLEGTVAGTAVFQRKPEVINDLRKEETYSRSLSHKNLSSLLAMPIFFKDMPLGVIQLYTKEKYFFSKKEINLVESLAAPLIGLAVKQAKLGNQRLLALLDVSKILSSKSDLKDILETIVKSASETLKVKRCTLFLLNEIGDKIKLAAGLPIKEHGVGLEWLVESYPAIKSVIETKNVLLVENPKDNFLVNDSRELTRIYEINAILFIPLIFEGKILGVSVYDATGDKKMFTPQEIGVCKILGNIAAAAIARAREQEVFQQEMLTKNRLELIGKAALEIAHEIRNPLMAVSGFVKRLLKAKTSEELAECEKIIFQEMGRVETILNEVLEYSHRKKLNSSRADLNSLIRETVSLFENVFNEKGIICYFNLDIGISEMDLDEEKIKRALSDLLRNAIEELSKHKIKQQKKEITIETKNKKDGYIQIKISNNIAEPIKQEIIDNIFNPFYTTKSHGTGLGLANALTNFSLHNGHIKVNLEEERITFIIQLPIYQ